MSTIPAGYRITFESTNDNGDTQHVIREGLNEDEASLFIGLANIIQGDNTLACRSIMRTIDVQHIHHALIDVFSQYAHLFTEKQLDEFKDDSGAIIDYLSDNMLNYSYERFEHIEMRELKSYKAEYVPEDIILEDVTIELKNNLKIKP